MHHQLLRILALLFVALVLLQSLLGGALFILLSGWNPDEIARYYADKSMHGLLETLAPHTLFISIALMGTLHFFGFISAISEKQKGRLIHLLFGLFALDQGSAILINLGIDLFAWIKIVSFIGFECVLVWGLVVIFRGSLQGSLLHHSDG